MTTIITYGTFDLFHIGHVNLLRSLSFLGSRLVVGCSTDEFNLKKGKRAIIPFADRVEILKSCRYVDAVFAESSWDQKPDDIAREKADIFAMGNDWAGKFDDLNSVCRVMYLPRTDNISSTELRTIVHALRQEEIQQVKAAVSNLNRVVDKL